MQWLIGDAEDHTCLQVPTYSTLAFCPLWTSRRPYDAIMLQIVPGTVHSLRNALHSLSGLILWSTSECSDFNSELFFSCDSHCMTNIIGSICNGDLIGPVHRRHPGFDCGAIYFWGKVWPELSQLVTASVRGASIRHTTISAQPARSFQSFDWPGFPQTHKSALRCDAHRMYLATMRANHTILPAGYRILSLGSFDLLQT